MNAYEIVHILVTQLGFETQRWVSVYCNFIASYFGHTKDFDWEDKGGAITEGGLLISAINLTSIKGTGLHCLADLPRIAGP